ncbi:hypothetical protein ACHAPI_009964 [Fusarium lateritium]
MEKPTATSNNYSEQTHPAPQHDIDQQHGINQQQPPQYENRDYNSPLAQPPLNNQSTTPTPAHQAPQDKHAVPQGQAQQQNFQSMPIQNLQSQSAPVVCPSCGVRSMTVTKIESGGMMQ